MPESNAEKSYDTFAVEEVEDDIFGTGSIVSSFGYRSEDGIKEVYLEDVNEENGIIEYSLRGFGEIESREEHGTINYQEAKDPEEIIDSILSDSGDQWQISETDLTGSGTAQTYER